jgi:ATP-dependent Clp protease, protease subunit
MVAARGKSETSGMDAPETSTDLELRAEHALLPKHLFGARTVLIFGEVNPRLAESVTGQLLALAASGDEPIRIVISSQGGHVESGDVIHDVIRFIEPDVRVIGAGWVASAGALIYVAAKREHRFALPNTRFMLHEPSGGMSGPVADIAIEAHQMLAMRARLLKIFADATGQPVERLAEDTRRNRWLSAAEAVDYGLAGRIIERASEIAIR